MNAILSAKEPYANASLHARTRDPKEADASGDAFAMLLACLSPTPQLNQQSGAPDAAQDGDEISSAPQTIEGGAAQSESLASNLRVNSQIVAPSTQVEDQTTTEFISAGNALAPLDGEIIADQTSSDSTKRLPNPARSLSETSAAQASDAQTVQPFMDATDDARSVVSDALKPTAFDSASSEVNGLQLKINNASALIEASQKGAAESRSNLATDKFFAVHSAAARDAANDSQVSKTFESRSARWLLESPARGISFEISPRVETPRQIVNVSALKSLFAESSNAASIERPQISGQAAGGETPERDSSRDDAPPHEASATISFGDAAREARAANAPESFSQTLGAHSPDVAAQVLSPLLAQAQAMTRREARTFSFHLRPDELGRVEVRITRDGDGRLSARINAESDTARHALASDVERLRDSLEQAGVRFERVEVGSLRFDFNSHANANSHAQDNLTRPEVPTLSLNANAEASAADNARDDAERLLSLRA